MKFEQIAIVADTRFTIQNIFNSDDSPWSHDLVQSKGVLLISGARNPEFKLIENVAELRFNYEVFPGKEFELIHYISGDNFLGHRLPGSISHFGLHVPEIDNLREYFEKKAFTLIQEVITIKHSSVPIDRHYHYAIFRNPELKFYFKLIERLKGDEEWHTAQTQLEERYNYDIF